MSIDKDTAARVAKLARIKVEEDALPALAQEFNTILALSNSSTRSMLKASSR